MVLDTLWFEVNKIKTVKLEKKKKEGEEEKKDREEVRGEDRIMKDVEEKIAGGVIDEEMKE